MGLAGHEEREPILFIDFDGTITHRDVIDAILEHFADERWREVRKQWQLGRIGSRECLHAQMSLVRTTRRCLDALIDSIQVDDGLALLLEVSARHQIPVHIVSDGFDYCIRRILERPQLKLGERLRGVRIWANQLEVDEARAWRIDFPFFHHVCVNGCATCKPAVMRLLNRADVPSIFVGGGLSDRYAAAKADLVFAKSSLAAYCREQTIPYAPYIDLDDVAASLVELLPFDSTNLSTLFQALAPEPELN